MLVNNHRHDGKKHRQQGGKRQRFGKGFSNSMFVRNAAQAGCKDNYRQANQPHLGKVEGQRSDKPHADEALCNQAQRLLARALFAALLVKLMQLLADLIGQRRAIPKEVEFFDQHTGG